MQQNQIFRLKFAKKTPVNKSILRRLTNSYDAYKHFPFDERFARFKEPKQYFLEGKEDIEIVYREFIYFHYAYLNKLFPKLKMEEGISESNVG